MSEAGATRVAARSRRGWRIGIVVVVIASLIAVVVVHLLGAHGNDRRRGMPPQVVRVAQATRGDMPETLSALGTVTPLATVTVLPQLSGYLTEVAYHEGQQVEKGQFLAQIDPRQFEVQKQQAEASLAKDQATLAQARSDLARFQQLLQQHSVAEQTYTDQTFLVKQDEAAVKLDQANVAAAALNISYCHITAPVAGRVGLRLVDPGNYVTASSNPGIVVITTTSPTTVIFTVAQNALGPVLKRFNAGAALPVVAYSSDNSTQLATGTLSAIDNQMSTSTGTVQLRASFANDDGALFPNEFVNAKLLVDTLSQAILVPTAAVQSGVPGNYVYVVNADHTVSVRKVGLGSSDGVHTVITSGLAAGETVVIDGLDRLSDGARVVVPSADPAAPSASWAGKPHAGGHHRAHASASQS